MLALLLALLVLPPFLPVALPAAGALLAARLADRPPSAIAAPVADPGPAGLPVVDALRGRDGRAFDDRRVAVRGRLRMVGAGRDRHYVVTTSDGVDVHLELPRSEFGRIEALQGRPGECRGTFECRARRYANPRHDRTDFHLYPDAIVPILPGPAPPR